MKTCFILFLILTTCTLRAELVVSGGFLVVKNGTLNSVGTTTVADGAVLRIHESCSLKSTLLHVLAGGLVEDCGTIEAEVLNEGEIVANCGPTTAITFIGAVSNQGTVRASGGSGIIADVTFDNSGVLDLIFGDTEIPTVLSGSGVILTPKRLPALQVTEGADGSVSLSYQVFRPYRYRVEWSETLAPDSWNLLFLDAGPVGETGIRTLDDSSATDRPQRFYRYGVFE